MIESDKFDLNTWEIAPSYDSGFRDGLNGSATKYLLQSPVRVLGNDRFNLTNYFTGYAIGVESLLELNGTEFIKYKDRYEISKEGVYCPTFIIRIPRSRRGFYLGVDGMEFDPVIIVHGIRTNLPTDFKFSEFVNKGFELGKKVRELTSASNPAESHDLTT